MLSPPNPLWMGDTPPSHHANRQRCVDLCRSVASTLCADLCYNGRQCMRTTACLVLKETLHGRGISLSRRRWHVPMHWTAIERSMNHWQCLHHRFNPIDHVDPFPTQTHARMRTQQRSIITINAAFFSVWNRSSRLFNSARSLLPSFLPFPASFLSLFPPFLHLAYLDVVFEGRHSTSI